MTGQRPEHDRFDELAAGYALHALEPGEEAEFFRHAEQCGRCQQALAGYAEVAAAMADLAAPAEASPDLAARIMHAATASTAARDQRGAAASPAARGQAGAAQHDSLAAAGGQQVPPGQAAQAAEPGNSARIIPLARRRSRLVRYATAAAAAVVLAGGGIWAGLSAASNPASPRLLAACEQAHQCSEVTLTDAAGHRQAAKVIVKSGSVWLIPAALPADDAARQIYVLWQITGAHTPLAVGSFDIRSGRNAPIKIGSLAAPFGSTWAFAVSLEHGRTIPAKPSRPVALGQTA